MASAARADFTIDQEWRRYRDGEHAIWRALFARQARVLKGRAAPEFLDGLHGLGIAADGIPDFERLGDALEAATGWRIVAVPGLVPDDVFFRHLANRRFPATRFIRRRDQLDCLAEPDVFHDIYGHVPLLLNPVFADYMQAYGKGGLKALGLGGLRNLARLYWYTVEFGLVRTPRRPAHLRLGHSFVEGRIDHLPRGPGTQPHRLRPDARDAHRLPHRRLPGVLFRHRFVRVAVRGDAARLQPYCAELETMTDLAPGEVLPGDRVIDSTSASA